MRREEHDGLVPDFSKLYCFEKAVGPCSGVFSQMTSSHGSAALAADLIVTFGVTGQCCDLAAQGPFL